MSQTHTHTHTVPIPLTAMTIYFVFAVMYLPAKPFFFLTTLFSWRFTHKSHGTLKRCSAVILKQAPKLKEYFVSWEHLLGRFRAHLKILPPPRIPHLHEHRKCIIFKGTAVLPSSDDTTTTTTTTRQTFWQMKSEEIDGPAMGKSRTRFRWMTELDVEEESTEKEQSEIDDGVLGLFLNYWEMSVREFLPQFCPGRYEFSAKRFKKKKTVPFAEFILIGK